MGAGAIVTKDAGQLLKVKRYDEAQAAYDNSVPLWRKAAELRTALGETNNAAQASKLAEIVPKFVSAQKIWDDAILANNQAAQLLDEKRYDEGQAAFEKTSVLWNKAAKARDDIGGKTEAAIARKHAENCSKAVPAKRAFDNAQVADDAAFSLLAAKTYDEAQTAFEKAAPLWQKAATAFEEIGQEKTTAFARKQAESQPKVVAIQKTLDEVKLADEQASGLLKEKRYEEAKTACAKVALLWQKAAATYEAIGDKRAVKARANAENYPKRVPAQKALDDAKLGTEEAARLLKDKRYDEANEAYQKAAQLWLKAAETQEAIGEKDNAAQERKYAENCPKFVPAQKVWDEAKRADEEASRLLLQEKRYDEPQVAYEKAAPLWHKAAKAFDEIGEKDNTLLARKNAENCPKLVPAQRALEAAKLAHENAFRLLKTKHYGEAQPAYAKAALLWQNAATNFDAIGDEDNALQAREYAENCLKALQENRMPITP